MTAEQRHTPEVAHSGSTGEVKEKRRARRKRSLKHGKLAFNHQYSTVDCVVRDLSETGARLVLENLPLTSEGLVLHVPVDDFMVPCERVWCEGYVWGVRFTGPRTHTRIGRAQVVCSSDVELDLPSARPARPQNPAAEPPAQPRPASAPRKPAFGKRR